LFLVGALLGTSLMAQSQDVGPRVSEKEYLEDMPVVLSVARLPQRLDETPGAVTVLDRRMIRMSGARDVADLLRLVPGFQVSNSFEGSAPQGSYHNSLGDFSNRMQVMVDGRSVYSPFLLGGTGIGLQTVAIEDIERIEVLRGSNSAAYGARAFLGTINIITRDPLDTLGATTQITLGDNSIQDVGVRLGGGNERISYRLGLDQRFDYGLSGSNGPDKVNRINFRADLHPGGSDSVELRVGQTVIDAGAGFSGQPGNAPRIRDIDTSYAQIDWHRNLGQDSDLSFQVSHMREMIRDRYAYVPVPGLFIDTGGKGINDNISLQHTLRYGSNLRLVWGGELRRESTTSLALYNTSDEFVTDFSRLFGNAEWHLIPSVVLNAGGMFERSNLSGEHVSPRVMLNWHLDDSQTLRYGVSQAYRPPSVYERYSNVRFTDPASGVLLDSTDVSRGNVGAEKVFAREIGYLADFPKVGFNLDIRIFEEQVSDVINRVRYDLPGSGALNTSVFDWVNAENFTNHGVEYQLRYQPWRGGKLMFSQSYVDSTQSPGVDANGVAIAPRPYNSTSLMFMQHMDSGLDFSLMYFQVDPAKFAGSNNIAPAMSRTDVRFAWPLHMGLQHGEISFVIQNLGPAYQDFLPDFYFRRQAYVMLRLDN
jgi:iron complex outermembrane receptor protein